MPAETRILIFENDPTDAEAIEMQLRNARIPFVSRRVGTKELFIKTLLEYVPDLIIADYSVPRFDALAALRTSNEITPGIPWIIVSGIMNEDVTAECMKAGAADYIRKKNMGRLGPSVVQALEKKTSGNNEKNINENAKDASGQECSELFKGIVEHVDDLVAVLDLKGKRIYNSPSFGNILEDPDTLRGTDSFVDIHPDDRAMVKQVFEETLRTGHGRRLAYRLMDKDGNTRLMESQGSLIRDEDGEPVSVVVVSRDVSLQRHANTVLRGLADAAAVPGGDDFFTNLVRQLADALGVRFALVSECIDGTCDRVRSLAYWADGKWVSSFEYDVAGTTCQNVLKQGMLCYYPENIQWLFPDEKALAAMGAVSYMGVPLCGVSGKPIGHLFIMDDKTLADAALAKSALSLSALRAAMELERKRGTEVSKGSDGSHDQFRMAVESLPEAVMMTNRSGLVTYVNRPVVIQTGYVEEEIVGKHISELLLPPDTWTLRAARRSGELRRSNGTIFHCTISVTPCRNGSGETVGTIVVIAGLERKAQSLKQFPDATQLLEQAHDAVILRDLEDRILFWNGSAERLYGWTLEEALGQKAAELLCGADAANYDVAAEKTMLEGSWTGELSHRTKEGKDVLVESRWTLLHEAEGGSGLVLIMDTVGTERSKSHEEAFRKRRMESVGALSSGIAQDLSNVLSPVLRGSKALSTKVIDEQSRQLVREIQSAAKRGSELGSRILALSKVVEAHSPLVEPGELLKNLERYLRGSFPQSIRIVTIIPKGIWSIKGSGEQLRQVLMSICENAKDSMVNGGVLRMAAENVTLEDNASRVHRDARPGPYVSFTVSDVGGGIAPDVVDRVFDPFFTTKHDGGVGGLGLSTAAALVKGNNGFMTLSSTVGKGTIVKVFLPAVGGREQAEEAARRMGHKGAGELVLVVDGEASMREIMKATLEAHGYEVVAARDGAEAVALCKQNSGNVKAVLIDMMVSFVDGSSIIRILKKIAPQLKIIATTDGAVDAQIAEAAGPGIRAFLPKNYSIERLLKTLHDILQGD